jgi:uncharacterized protein
MTDITPLIRADSSIIQGYTPSSVRISGATHTGPVIVTPERVLPWGGDWADLVRQAAAAAEQGRLTLVLVVSAMADEMIVSNDLKTLRDDLRAHGVTLEVLERGAACRTFNVLMAEGRDLWAVFR